MGKNIIILSIFVSMFVLTSDSYGNQTDTDLSQSKLDHSTGTYYRVIVVEVDGKPEAILQIIADGVTAFYNSSGQLLNIIPTAQNQDIRDKLAMLAIATEKTMTLLNIANSSEHKQKAGDPEDYGNSKYNFLKRYVPAASILDNNYGWNFIDFDSLGKGDPTTSEPSNFVEVLK